MNTPHQRSQSGKLRPSKTKGGNYKPLSRIRAEEQTPGIENARLVGDVDADDEVARHRQTPTTLTDTQVSTLLRAARGLGVSDESCVDRNWRCTWNIGRWKISDDLYISANMAQPNVSGMWANLRDCDSEGIREIARNFSSLDLERSAATVSVVNRLVELQGRWTPFVLDASLSAGLVDMADVDITYVNLSQARLFFWVILGDEEYFCTPTKDTIEVMRKYVPESFMGIVEVSANNNLTMKPDANKQREDAASLGRAVRVTFTQLSLNSYGWVQLVGNDSNVESLYGSLSAMVRRTIESVHIRTFMRSLEYNVCEYAE